MQSSDKHPAQRPFSWLWMAIPFVAFGLGVHVYQNGWVALLLYHCLIGLALTIGRRHWQLKSLFAGGSLVWVLAIRWQCQGVATPWIAHFCGDALFVYLIVALGK